jgi:uncharacterized protein
MLMGNSTNTLTATGNPLATADTKKGRISALLRLLGFMGIAIALTAAAIFLAHVLKIKLDFNANLNAKILLVAQAVQTLLMVVIPTAVMMGLTREPATYFGWGVSNRLRQLAIGVLAGALLMTALLLTLIAMGACSLGTVALTVPQSITHGLAYAVVFALVAIAEEGFLRGYALVQLSRAVSFWPAAIITSIIFMVLHLTHATETPVALLQAGLIALVFAYSFRRSGALWFALGFHAAWDFVQTYVFGVPDSGVSATDVLMHSSLHGPAWLTGGSAGPEGSYLALPITAIAALIAHYALKPRANR